MKLIEHIKPDETVNKETLNFKIGNNHYCRVHDIDSGDITWWLENVIPITGGSVAEQLEEKFQSVEYGIL